MQNITAQTLHQWMHDAAMAPSVLLVDVREIDECKTGMLPMAVHVPLADVTLGQLAIQSKHHIVFQCRSGVRSVTACHKIAHELPEGVQTYSLQGGILAWAAEGFEVVV